MIMLVVAALIFFLGLMVFGALFLSGLVRMTAEESKQLVEEWLNSEERPSERMLNDFAAGRVSRERAEVLGCMRLLWREMQVLMHVWQGNGFALLLFFAFAVAWGAAWLRNLMAPNSDTLRLLLGLEAFTMLQVMGKRPAILDRE